jgi:FSR family fosmidomycin resistance protein-like MFS transporter
MTTDSLRQNTFNLKMLLVLSFGHLATDLYQSALPAILPILKDKLLLSYTMAGVIMMASNVTSSVIQPLFGYLSDNKEKPLLLPFGCLAAGLGLSLLDLPARYEAVVLLTIFSGLGVASYHPEGFKTARSFTGDKMATGMAVFTVGGNMGLALGPLAVTSIITYFRFEYLPLMLVFALVFLVLLALNRRSLGLARNVSVRRETGQPGPSRAEYISLGLIIAVVVMRSWTAFGLMAYIPMNYIDVEKGDPLYAGTLVTAFLMGGAFGTLLGSPLADRWGYKRYLIASLAVTSALFPLIFITHGIARFVALAAVGMAMISTFTVTVVMGQDLLPNNLGVASGLMAGFAIGTGGVGVTILGVVADHFGAPVALKSITLLPFVGLIISCFIPYPARRKEPVEA